MKLQQIFKLFVGFEQNNIFWQRDLIGAFIEQSPGNHDPRLVEGSAEFRDILLQ